MAGLPQRLGIEGQVGEERARALGVEEGVFEKRLGAGARDSNAHPLDIVLLGRDHRFDPRRVQDLDVARLPIAEEHPLTTAEARAPERHAEPSAAGTLVRLDGMDYGLLGEVTPSEEDVDPAPLSRPIAVVVGGGDDDEVALTVVVEVPRGVSADPEQRPA